MTVGVQQILGPRPVPADFLDQAVQMCSAFRPFGASRRAQQVPDQPTVPIEDNDGLGPEGGMIDQSDTRDTACVPMARCGRHLVWNPRRGNDLGQRSCGSASTGRTYERKRSDQNRQRVLAGRRPPTYGISIPSGGATHPIINAALHLSEMVLWQGNELGFPVTD